MTTRSLTLPHRLLAAEVDFCRRATRVQERRRTTALFRAVSWLGDGPIWFALALALPLIVGLDALHTVARLAIVGVVCGLVAKLLKNATARERPFSAHPGIPLGARALDRGSFPSGHTLHAVAFTMVAVADLPALAVLLVPFTLAVAVSRVVLGLHYPSDVMAGALVGAAIAAAALGLL